MVIDRHTGETVEVLGSGTALGRLAGEDPAAVTARAAAGDAQARALLDEVTGSLAVGVLNLAYCFMPERIVIGGGLAQAGDMLLQRVREVLAAARPAHSVAPDEVRLAVGGDDVGLLGAFALAADIVGARWQPPPLTLAAPTRAASRP
jgi:glucokinase